jgi:hypothetical protein
LAEQKQQAEAAEAVKYAREQKVPMTKELQAALETAVKFHFKDPDSATFLHSGIFKKVNGGLEERGQANSKNSYGSYGGFTRYNAISVEIVGKYVPFSAVFVGESKSPFNKYYPQCFAPID